ncbi:hypothetical protein ACO0SA_004266 [Hanseniaspora valbyensis]
MSDKNVDQESDDSMILFPKATILRIAKKNHPGLLITKDAQEALQHSATLYLNYIYSLARMTAVSHNRRNISLEDILEALDSNGLDALDLKESTREQLERYDLAERNKRQRNGQDKVEEQSEEQQTEETEKEKEETEMEKDETENEE